MKESEKILNPNRIVNHLNKPASEFTRADIMKIVKDFQIEMLNFRYVAEDGKLKTLNFVINSLDHLDTILATGERVDGSSLFSYVEADTSDLYVIPRFNTAFLNPFSTIPTLDILCSFYNNEGLALESAPEYILRKAHNDFKEETGLNLKALGELEYYVSGGKKEMYPAVDQKGYHASTPYVKYEHIRIEAMRLIAQCGGQIKYGHSEVGNFSNDEEYFEQNEIEFLPVNLEDAADQMVIAKWIIRNLGEKYGVNISFAPKITVGKAGSGLHIHLLAEKDGVNVMADENGLTDTAKKIIAGLLDLAAPMTAFGNTIPTSYLRLVPHQEAPTNICWGDRNRSVLVRIPLGWNAKTSMIRNANPQETGEVPYIPGKQTVELRSPDGSADVYLLLAGIAVAAKQGILNPKSLEIAKKLYVGVNIFKDENKKRCDELEKLPASCHESAERLNQKRNIFEHKNIFPAGTIDRIINQLKSYDDKSLSEKLYGNNEEIRKLVNKYYHWM